MLGFFWETGEKNPAIHTFMSKRAFLFKKKKKKLVFLHNLN